MKTSEMIAHLAKHMAEHGDMDVRIDTDSGWVTPYSEASFQLGKSGFRAASPEALDIFTIQAK